MWRILSKNRALFYTAGVASACGAGLVYKRNKPKPCHAAANPPELFDRIPSRENHIDFVSDNELDMLVIGGGATGAGCTLDAASRGLSVAVVEKFDFASGTSSRSTKLIHGGVRYLQKAIMKLDIEQYRMVKEALNERGNLLEIAPHLAYKCPIMLPVYKWWQVPYFWAGLKCYDMVAGRKKLEWSYYLPKKRALELFPMLKKDALKGALVYYDGQHEDARMCLSVIMTAARLGAKTLNYTEVIELLHETNEHGKKRVCGAKVRDKVTMKEYNIRAKCVVNATGYYTDIIRTMNDENIQKICQPSSGTHIILPNYYSPDKMGLLDPATSDGRVIFFLPWQDATIAGTTDRKCDITDNPTPTESDVEFILSEIRNYLHSDVNVRRGDVQSCWTGLRPLVMDPNKKDTQSLARNHIIEVSDTKLITIAGGKWTTYRHMAEETVDRAVEECSLPVKRSCPTLGLLLDGAHQWSPTMHIKLVQDFGLDVKVAEHLAQTYGDRAFNVCKFAQMTGLHWPVVGKRLHPDYPYIEAEVRWAVRVEYARRALDIIARRTRLSFLNVTAAEQALPRIVEIMGEELGWSKKKCKDEHDYCVGYLCKEMGLNLRKHDDFSDVHFTKKELDDYIKRFRQLDVDAKGYITMNDLRKFMKDRGEKVTDEQLTEILNEVDLDKNGQIALDEFLKLMSGVKNGTISNNRLVAVTKIQRKKISLERSGGGV